MKEAQQEDQQADRDRQVQDIQRLDIAEMMLLGALMAKVEGSVPEDTDVIKNFFKDDDTINNTPADEDDDSDVTTERVRL